MAAAVTPPPPPEDWQEMALVTGKCWVERALRTHLLEKSPTLGKQSTFAYLGLNLLSVTKLYCNVP